MSDKLKLHSYDNQQAYFPNISSYNQLYQKSITHTDEFWAEEANKFLTFYKKWDKVSEFKYSKDEVYIKWFEGAKLNVCYNCVDRHADKTPNKTAIIWESDNPKISSKITYAELKDNVSRFANILKKHKVKKGDVVTIYMPMIPEAAYAMLACARIGAIHSVVFGGFSPEALKERIIDGKSKFVITADEGVRAGKTVPLKKNVDTAIKLLEETAKNKKETAQEDGKELAKLSDDLQCLVIKHTFNEKVTYEIGRDFVYQDELPTVSNNCECEIMDAEDALFILYTSGSTGKPKGLLHTSAGYLLYTAVTHKYVFDYHDGDIYWCTADIGWITGHSYIIYGPLANGATTLMFEGTPNHPTVSRFFDVVQKHKVNQFYTAPTAVRMLMAEGERSYTGVDLSSLKILGSVGEPINPEAWSWYNDKIGKNKCPIVDTWWQTETGGFLITPLPFATKLQPASATKPFFGVEPVIVDDTNKPVAPNTKGALCINKSWPAQARTIWGNHKRFIDTYFTQYSGRYFSGDGAFFDTSLEPTGNYVITGRMDDVINISGHRIGTAEVESALVMHKEIAEAAVVGIPHKIKGQAIFGYVVLNSDSTLDVNCHKTIQKLNEELAEIVKREIGSLAKPEAVLVVKALPKTRSGKIMRRILRKIAIDDFDDFGDTKTLLNPEAVKDIIISKKNSTT